MTLQIINDISVKIKISVAKIFTLFLLLPLFRSVELNDLLPQLLNQFTCNNGFVLGSNSAC